jgi:hypothetical protein
MKRVLNSLVRVCFWPAGYSRAVIVGLVVVLMTSAASPAWGQWANCSGGVCYTSGNVGIGTTTPSFPVTIVYSDNAFGRGIELQNTNSGTYAITGIALNNGSGSNVGELDYFSPAYANPALQNTAAFSTVNTTKLGFISGANLASPPYPDIYFQPGGSTPAVYIKGTSGYVGIGTTNPQHLLHVAGTIGAEEVIVSSTGADYVFQPGYRLRPLSEVNAFIQENHHLPDLGVARIGIGLQQYLVRGRRIKRDLSLGDARIGRAVSPMGAYAGTEREWHVHPDFGCVRRPWQCGQQD